MQLAIFLKGIRSWLSEKQFRYVIFMLIFLGVALITGVVLLALSGYVPALTGRFKSLIGSTSNIAIVKSVSEHQPTSWSTFFLDLHILSLFSIPGLYFCFTNLSDANLFIILYLVSSAYFASIMVRLMLVISPIVCIIGGIGLSETLLTFSHVMLSPSPEEKKADGAAATSSTPTNKKVGLF
jgi:dolichyl-diphosphooligosaccharide--protein glycosyltransferase